MVFTDYLGVNPAAIGMVLSVGVFIDMITDIIMPQMDGYALLEEMRRRELPSKPQTIVVSALGRDDFVTRAIELGATFYMVKPFDMRHLMSHIRDLSGGRIRQADAAPTPRETHRVQTLDERLGSLFLTISIPAHIKGYQFLREAIKMAVDTPDIINNITKKLYPSIADKFDTSSSKVERAIRHAIEVAWNRGKIENINSIFGIKVYTANDKPTNGEFIALVADKMILEGA